MLREVLHWLQLSEGLTVMDGTVGAGGHSSRILNLIGDNGQLLGFDRDPMMLDHARKKLTGSNVTLICGCYADSQDYLDRIGINRVDRVLLDLGLSSDQLSDVDRGFGFDSGGPLDMRFDASTGIDAATLLRTVEPEQLESIFRDFGEEPFARKIAAEICRRRGTSPVETTEDLENCVQSVVPRGSAGGNKNPATRVFQALRIAVNEELGHVKRMMTSVLPEILNPGGVVVVLTFHSLEDRIVKNAFKGQQQWTALTKKPIEATPAETRLNPRSRSAKLRAARRISP